ncbi:MAG: sulfatase-like hydrolase/transferase, partial [Candidatus Hydrogenedentes bacterium]|nr:sulfatase-like hydrolase/transferase [Candidatus Hydrogenedentota bacterium]
LHETGYTTYFFFADCGNKWPGYEDLLGHAVDRHVSGDSSQVFTINDDRVLLEALDAVPDACGPPAFFVFWLMSCHCLGVRDDACCRYKPCELENTYWTNFVEGRHEPERLLNRYDNGILQADRFTEQILAMLEHKGYADNALVFVTGDHGDGFGEHGHYCHSNHVHQEDLCVPLLIGDDPEVRYEGLEFATHLDVAPTIVERLGLPIPPFWQGESLLRPRNGRFSYHSTLRGAPRRAVVFRADDGVYKYIKSHRRAEAFEVDEELYCLSTDPGERANRIASADPRLVRLMRGKLAEFWAPAGGPAGSPAETPAETSATAVAQGPEPGL